MPQIDDLLVISVRKDGGIDLVKASSIGFHLRAAVMIWGAVMELYIGLATLQDALAEHTV